MRRRAYVAAGILAVLAVGGCSQSSGGKSSAGGAVSNGGAIARPAVGGLPADKPAGGAAGDATDSGTVSGRSGTANSVAKTLPLDDGTYKIRTAQLTVAVPGARNVAAKADGAITIAEQAGGEVDSDNRTSGPRASATMQLRVPPDELTTTLSALGKLGVEKSRELSTTDVTQKVADVTSRVTSAQESIARLRALYAHATRVAVIIQIESELNSREADLESLEAQQRSLSRQTSMATITLSLVTAAKQAAPPAKPAKKRGGFLGAVERGWHGFAATALWVAEAIGTILPFLVLLLVVALGARLLWPRLPHRHARTPAPSPSE